MIQKRILSKAARSAMAAGGRKASKEQKARAGREGWRAMIRTQANIFARK